MKRYSAFAIAREALRFHSGWERAWRSPAPKKRYDVIIVGAGGHGMASAYYLGKNFGITNVAVLEKGWLGGGNTGAKHDHSIELPKDRRRRPRKGRSRQRPEPDLLYVMFPRRGTSGTTHMSAGKRPG